MGIVHFSSSVLVLKGLGVCRRVSIGLVYSSYLSRMDMDIFHGSVLCVPLFPSVAASEGLRVSMQVSIEF